MLRFVKVATPFTAFTVVVPERVIPEVSIPGETKMVTGAVALVTVLPKSSWMVTTG
jgi:hypothetical protein